MLGPRGINFDNDDGPVPDELEFAGDPVLELDMVVRHRLCWLCLAGSDVGLLVSTLVILERGCW